MSMETKTSLREWAKEKKVWEPETWRTFLKEDLVPFYKQAYTLNAFYEFLKGEKICGKPSLADIDDETLKNKIRVAIYGGVEPNKDFNKSFAKFMYDNFGICAENASSFEESIKHYENWGDSIKVSVNPNSRIWINRIRIGDLVNELKNLIQKFCDKLNIKLSEIGIQESYPYSPLEVIEPDALLPQAGEKPEKLVSLLNDFKQKALNLSIGINPFTTFVFYSRTIPMLTLMKFLECDIDKIINLAKFLELKAYSMIDLKEVGLHTKSPDKVILSRDEMELRYKKIISILGKTLDLQSYLEKIDPTIKQIHESMIKQAVDQIHITFEPWKDYKPIFFYLNEILKDQYYLISLYVKNGEIVKISGREDLPKIWLNDFLLKISPCFSAGLVEISCDYINEIRLTNRVPLKFHPFAKEWIDKVIKNEGKT